MKQTEGFTGSYYYPNICFDWSFPIHLLQMQLIPCCCSAYNISVAKVTILLQSDFSY